MRITTVDANGNPVTPRSPLDVAAEAARELAEIIDPAQPDTVAAALMREHDRAVLDGPPGWSWASLAGDIVAEVAGDARLPRADAEIWCSLALAAVAHYGEGAQRQDVVALAVEAVERHRVRKEMESWSSARERPCGS